MTVATTIGTVVAYSLVPMRSLGQDSWKIAAALMSRHIGGGNLVHITVVAPTDLDVNTKNKANGIRKVLKLPIAIHYLDELSHALY